MNARLCWDNHINETAQTNAPLHCKHTAGDQTSTTKEATAVYSWNVWRMCIIRNNTNYLIYLFTYTQICTGSAQKVLTIFNIRNKMHSYIVTLASQKQLFYTQLLTYWIIHLAMRWCWENVLSVTSHLSIMTEWLSQLDLYHVLLTTYKFCFYKFCSPVESIKMINDLCLIKLWHKCFK